jgi:hypothetical protein
LPVLFFLLRECVLWSPVAVRGVTSSRLDLAQFICPWNAKPVLMFVLFVSCHFKVSLFDPSDQ